MKSVALYHRVFENTGVNIELHKCKYIYLHLERYFYGTILTGVISVREKGVSQ